MWLEDVFDSKEKHYKWIQYESMWDALILWYTHIQMRYLCGYHIYMAYIYHFVNIVVALHHLVSIFKIANLNGTAEPVATLIVWANQMNLTPSKDCDGCLFMFMTILQQLMFSDVQELSKSRQESAVVKCWHNSSNIIVVLCQLMV